MHQENIFIVNVDPAVPKLSQIAPQLIYRIPSTWDLDEHDEQKVTKSTEYPYQVGLRSLFHHVARVMFAPKQKHDLYSFYSGQDGVENELSLANVRTTLFGCFQVILTILIGYYIYTFPLQVSVELGFDHFEQRNTLAIAEAIMFAVTMASDFVGGIFFLTNGKSVQRHLAELEKTLHLFGKEVKDASWIQPWFQKKMAAKRYTIVGFNFAIFFASVITCRSQLCKIYEAVRTGTVDQLDNFTWSFPIMSVLWTLVLFWRLYFRLLLATLIDILEFGFRTIGEQAEKLKKECSGDTMVKVELKDVTETVKVRKGHLVDMSATKYLREVQLSQIVDKYRTMEQLLQGFNEIYATQLLISIFSLVVVLLMTLFHFIVEIRLASPRAIPYGIQVFLYALAMFTFGSSATEMASQVSQLKK